MDGDQGRAQVNLITGFFRAGTTGLVRHLLSRRPPGERWGVLLHERGAAGRDGAPWPGAAGNDVAVREVPGGCPCCAARVPVQVALTDLLRRARPRRALVEAPGAVHAAALLDALTEGSLAGAVDLRATLCVVDPSQHAALAAGPAADLYAAQLACADLIVLGEVALARAADVAAARDAVEALFPRKRAVLDATAAAIDPGWLEEKAGAAGPPAAVGHPGPAGLAGEPAAAAHAAVSLDDAPDGAQRAIWRFDADLRFDARAIEALFGALPAPAAPAIPLRARGAYRVGDARRRIDWAGARVQVAPLAWRGESCFEVICASGAAPGWWTAIGRALTAAVKPEKTPTGRPRNG